MLAAYLFDKKFLPLILCAILLLALSFFLIELPYFNSSYYSTKLLLMPFSLFVAFFISYGLYAFNPKLIKIMVTVLFLTSLFNAESFNQSLNAAVQTERMNSKIQTLAKSRQMIAKPDIFLLTYESYVCNETMLKYGIDNSDQESYLIQKGFTIYPGVYTIGPGSTISMNAVFDVSSDEKTAQGATSGNGNVQRLLQYHGYETFGIFSNNYFFWGQSFDYDHCFPSANISEKLGAPIILLASILQGEFGCFAGFNGFAYSIYLSEKQDTLALPRKAKPRFVYTHNRYPGHSQYSGLIIVGDEIDIYRAGLQKANAEMKSDVETLIKSNPESIIIINGDHGPRLLQNVEHINKIGRVNIQDRYGSFLAIKWPENIHVQYNKISVLQDTFPVILAVLFNTTEFINTKVAPKTLQPETVAGAFVDNGIIIGGKDDGKPLYELSNLFSEP